MDRYIEHIINDLVRDTIINYDREEIHFPFISSPLPTSFSSFLSSPLPFFSKYSKERYGLTEEEIKYVWRGYVGILKDKIRNNE